MTCDIVCSIMLLAGVEGLEPSRTVLETAMLPITSYPYILFFSAYHLSNATLGLYQNKNGVSIILERQQ